MGWGAFDDPFAPPKDLRGRTGRHAQPRHKRRRFIPAWECTCGSRIYGQDRRRGFTECNKCRNRKPARTEVANPSQEKRPLKGSFRERVRNTKSRPRQRQLGTAPLPGNNPLFRKMLLAGKRFLKAGKYRNATSYFIEAKKYANTHDEIVTVDKCLSDAESGSP